MQIIIIEELNLFFFCSGARETDYPAGEEVPPSSEAGAAGDGSSSETNSSSADGGGVLGGITVVGCEAEGGAAVPHTAEHPGKRPRTKGHTIVS